MAKTYFKNGLEYTSSNHRMKFNPEYHKNHRCPYSEEEKAYMCAMWDHMNKADIALALERTPGTISNQVYLLKKQHKFEYYRQMGKNL